MTSLTTRSATVLHYPTLLANNKYPAIWTSHLVKMTVCDRLEGSGVEGPTEKTPKITDLML